jgi:co-chaperonin GroES (HSP10)
VKPATLTEAPEQAKTIRPLHDYLVVKPLTRPGMIGLIHLPEQADDNRNGTIAEVLAVGPGRLLPSGIRIPMEVSVGDCVHLTAYGTTAAGCKIVLNGEKVLMIRARDINGICDRPVAA